MLLKNVTGGGATWCDHMTSFYCTFLEFMALSLKEVSCPWIRPFLMPKVKYKKIELY